ncbi:TonB-dependent receptor domain-containing protein [Flavobacterium luminosum]|uniref:TonB-dependent receptor n=1 Tax=Flavobacterium luminosum TaxID=2949086 RepID=A0ABT0TKB8_9FLAO|nr:TonB-dependent receptor [Flavobacterium sp. HXWNR70]MCL9807907.1 TonB-dependent receptor [Flavobacterium sp. HXWNR70]
MKKNTIVWGLLFFSISMLWSQSPIVDSLKTKELKEVIVIGKNNHPADKQEKPLATVEEYLQKSHKVGMIKRGAYAWEPMLNSMATERTVLTIDGMRIFGACTDKMDPMTSYVEISNLSEATIHSGQEGAHFGNTIGGSVDLKRTKSNFDQGGWKGSLQSGFESNNSQKIIGGKLNFSDSTLYVGSNFMYRDAENYKAGNHKEVLYSPFTKWNLSLTTGVKIAKNKVLEGSVIYDKAVDVGYPALPMDVSLAEAIITSLRYEVQPLGSSVKQWETKMYFNSITHKMDDTTRPDVPIHMDMPGWSKTFGMYSILSGTVKEHDLQLNLNSFYNSALAEMTMYPKDPNESEMYMYTWPNIGTFYTGVFAEDRWWLEDHQSLKFSLGLASHNNTFRDNLGRETLQIFYPDVSKTKARLLVSTSVNYQQEKNKLEWGVGLGYGDRAPSVSEGYGFYLFNSFDGFDYIGNPNLKNEKALEGNAFLTFKTKGIKSKLSAAYFHIYDYIIGIPHKTLVPMTIGANGVKVYTALKQAKQFSADWSTEIRWGKYILGKAHLGYSFGEGSKGEKLPLIRPLSYNFSLQYAQKQFNAEIEVQGNGVQNNYNPFFGEDKTADYAILNATIGYRFSVLKNQMMLKTGIENILDAYYTTYSDWKNIPRKGRNVFIHWTFEL